MKFELVVSCYWSECVELTNHDHVTVNRRSCRNIHLYQMHLSIVTLKLKEILLSVECLIFLRMPSRIYKMSKNTPISGSHFYKKQTQVHSSTVSGIIHY